MRRTAALMSVMVTLGVASVAHAATIFQINGGGYGHGVGMSQYGADGYALHGQTYQFILGHYFRGTTLGQTDPNQLVRVLLATGPAQFSGAAQAGTHKLNPSLTYSVRALASGGLALAGPAGKRLAKFTSPLTVDGPGPLNLAGHGAYRDGLEFSAAQGTVQTVNAVNLDDYVRGVIAAEMPSSWPAAALEAQAVAARTYAITSDVGGTAYQLYDDTRSQMYRGVAAETPATDAAVAATRGQILTYHGAPATAYFFSSSGGHTENNENVWLGTTPQPWLRGVKDPYDAAGGADPYHRWSDRMTLAQAQNKLGGLVKGRLRGIRVTNRGVSPRVISAAVVGTGGVTQATGPQLQGVFGLMSTYMRFTTIQAAAIRRGALPRVAFERVKSLPWNSGTFGGTVFPAAKHAFVVVEAWNGKRWRRVKRVRVRADGAYTARVSATGRFRVLYDGVAGPTITIG